MIRSVLASSVLLVMIPALGATAAESGSAVGWGSQVIVSADQLAGLRKTAAGAYHSVALKSDGSILAWGRNDFGQCQLPAAGASCTAWDSRRTTN